MSIFNKLFGSKTNKQKDSQEQERGKHMPKIELPIDEKFMIEFKENGGKFLYCSDEKEVLSHFDSILAENDWNGSECYIKNEDLINQFTPFNLNLTRKIDKAVFFVTTVEALVAEVGALMISSNQIAEIKLNEYPENLIIVAKTSQIVKNIGDGLTDIKNKNKPRIPSNITTIQHFKINETGEEKDFLTYGSFTKNVYLLLQEDL
jgi:hypothetical protein